MLTFNDLSLAQKKWVQLAELYDPEIKDTVTFRKIHEIHEALYKLREKNPKAKVGLPLWLIKHNVVSRGVYFFPAEKNSAPENVTPQGKSTKMEHSLEAEYQEELKKYGLVK